MKITCDSYELKTPKMRALPLRSFRLVCKPEQTPLVELLLKAQGFACEPEEFSPLARRLTAGYLPLGSSLAAVFGYIYIQDRSSMLPPLALAPEQGSAVLDMCASPGSKTGLLAQIVGPDGFVLANEPAGKRLATLRRTVRNLNLFCCATSSYPGEVFSLFPDQGVQSRPSRVHTRGDELTSGWDYIQLDPPCSGWGTAEKKPRVLRLWREDKLKPLIGLQRKLLAGAARLLRPGGRLVYSTCTTNSEENESQVHFAREELGLEFLPLEPLPGFSFADPALPECAGSWRVMAGAGGQGFFVALLQKPASGQGAASAAQSQGVHKGARIAHKDSRRADGHQQQKLVAEPLSRDLLDGPYLDAGLLPPGEVAVCGGVAHFLPERSRSLPGQGCAWKGFALGRFSRVLHPSPRLRCLMPPVETLRQKGLPCLDLDDPLPVLGLLAGRSVPVDSPGPETGLYFRGLPLCRLAVKGRRAILPGPG